MVSALSNSPTICLVHGWLSYCLTDPSSLRLVPFPVGRTSPSANRRSPSSKLVSTMTDASSLVDPLKTTKAGRPNILWLTKHFLADQASLGCQAFSSRLSISWQAKHLLAYQVSSGQPSIFWLTKPWLDNQIYSNSALTKHQLQWPRPPYPSGEAESCLVDPIIP